MASGGTEAFPDLGKHCQHDDCHQLDFLPFNCDGCRKVFCLDHRSYRSHECPKPDIKSRRVVVCDTCSAAIEITGKDEEEEKMVMKRHEESGRCDPSKKKKPICPVKRCREVLTFSNTSTCNTCRVTVCLRHRFPADHSCRAGQWNQKFLAGFGARTRGAKSSPTAKSTPSVKAY